MLISEFMQMYPHVGLDFEHRRLCYTGYLWQIWRLNPATHAQEELLIETMDEHGAVLALENGVPPIVDPTECPVPEEGV